MHKIILASILVSLLVLPNVTNFIILRADAAQVDYFLKIEGVPGESSDSKHKDWIDIQSYSFGATQTASSGGGGGAGKVKIQDLMITKPFDKSSPQLFIDTASGKHYPSATLELVNTAKSKETYMIITMKDVIITSYSTGNSGGEAPTEQLSFNFAKIELEYKQGGSSVKAGWDVKLNKKTDTSGSTTTPSSTSTSKNTTSSSVTGGTTQKDTDGDGITDDKDKCPKESETKNNYQDDDGCPDTAPVATTPSTVAPPSTITPKVVAPKDTDGDGITDDKDQCPTEAETKNNYQDDDGCPDSAPAVVPIKPRYP